VMMKALLYDNW